MLLNWHTVDACFLSSTFHIRSSFAFFLSCLAALLLVVSLEYIRRAQRNFDRYLRARNAVLQDEEYALPGETEEGASSKWKRKRKIDAQIERKNYGGSAWTTFERAHSYGAVLCQLLHHASVHVQQWWVLFLSSLFGEIIIQRNIMLIFNRLYHNFYPRGSAGGLCSFHEGYTQLSTESHVSTASLYPSGNYLIN